MTFRIISCTIRYGCSFLYDGVRCHLSKEDFRRLVDAEAPLGELRKLYKLK